MTRPQKSLNFSRYAVAAAIGTVAATEKAEADFSGAYTLNPPPNGIYTDPASGSHFGNWIATENVSIPNTLDSSLGPASLTLSFDDTFGSTANFDFLITAVGTGLLSFNWGANLTNNGSFVAAAFMLNGNQTDLSTSSGATSGTFSTALTAGDVFGFRLISNYHGAGSMTVSNFSAPVPEPNVNMLVAGGAAGLLALRALRRRRIARS